MTAREEPCHSHGHSQSFHATSSTVVDEEHSHPLGICCSASPSTCEESWLNDLDDTDVERGPSSYERVVLLIDGLQCGCCEGSISRTVARISAIRNHQVNIVLARLEFELDTNRLSVADAISNLGVKTGYTFQEFIAPTGQVLELLVTDSAKIHNAIMPFGITHVEIPEKETWYSPKLMSIRKGMDLAFRAAIARTLGPSCASAWRSY
jgi:copper chaperone CopZ